MRHESMTMLPNEPFFFRALADSSPLFIGICDLSLRPFYVNEAGRRLVGLDNQKNFAETPVKAFFFPEDQAFVLNEFFPRVLEDGRAETEIRFRHFKTGEAIWMTYDVFFLPDESGKPVGLATVSRDISGPKQTENALRVSEERLRLVTELAQVGYWHWDIQADSLEWSPSCKQLFGVPAQEPLSYGRFMSALHPEDRERVDSAVRTCLESGGQRDYDIEYRALWPDGAVRWIHAKGDAVFADGRPFRMAGIALDITERKHAEIALQQKTTLLQGVIESTPDRIYAKDIECRMLLANSATLETAGKPAAEVLGRSETEWHHDPEEAERIRANDRRIMETGRSETVEEIFATPGTAPRIFRSTKSPMRDAEGHVIGVVGVSEDVTALKEAEAALREADRRKNEFIATLAHELRNPLTPIHNATLVLRMKRDADDPDAALLDMIQRQTDHLVRLVDDLLEIGRISSGKIELRKEKSDIVAVLHDALASCQPLIDKKAHRVTTKVARPPLWVSADPVRLTQITVNLIDNAVKYTPPQGLIEVEAACEADEIVLRVRDNGVGIDADALPQVFDLFMQVEDRAGAPKGGLGIGLALARKLVELHEGRIEAHSAGPQRGSEFVVRLPQWQASTTIAAEALAATDEKGGDADRPARVLVIDDDHDVGGSFCFLMESLGMTVRAAYDGPSGIAAIDTFRPDAIFCDIGMPGVDGCETARRIRAAHGDGLLLIALTGWGQDEDRRRTQEAGFDAHLTKPASIEAIEALLRQIPRLSGALTRTPASG